MPPIIFNCKPLPPTLNKDIKNIVNNDMSFVTYYNLVKNKNKNKLEPNNKKKVENKSLAKLTDNEDEINI